jgi:sulfite exporter TauE/SafE
MALFGLGTLPLMLSLSLTGQLVPFAWRARMRQAVPVLATSLALLFIVRGLGLGIPYLSPQLSREVITTTKRSSQMPATMHYCHGEPTTPSTK